MLLCLSIIGPDLASVREQIAQAEKVGGMVELRADLYDNISAEELALIKKQCRLPVLLTLRSDKQGGKFVGDEAERRVYLRHLAAIQPELLDIELGTPRSDVAELRRLLPSTKIVLSYHDLSGMPEDLSLLLHQMQQTPADWYKIAATACSSIDALRMMSFTREVNRLGGHLCGLCMGPYGEITRVLAPIMGVPMTFACLNEQQSAAPGQISADVLHDVYFQQRLTSDSKVVALIGNPVNASKGYIVHNSVFKELSLPYVYVRMAMQPHELSEFFYLMRQLPFRGLSVTMPLKEAVIPFLDAVDGTAQAMGAVNTIIQDEGGLSGYNYDGMGALDAIEEVLEASVYGKSVVVLGAGGAAKAVAHEAKRRGAHVVIANRSHERAHELAHKLGTQAEPLERLPELLKSGPDVVAQMTSVGMLPDVEASLINRDDLQPNTLVFEAISAPKETRLLREAKERGCRVVPGLKMWEGQAIHQQLRWCERDLPAELVRDAIHHTMNLR